MISNRRRSAGSRLLPLLAVLGLAAGCTALDDYLPGTPFTPDQPEGRVTVVGAINNYPVEQNTEGCSVGGTLFWGTVRNTGDVDVEDVFIVIDAYGPAGDLLGSYRTNVFNGEIISPADPAVPDSYDVAATNLTVDQDGTFNVCAPLSYGSVARTEYRTEFIVVQQIENQ